MGRLMVRVFRDKRRTVRSDREEFAFSSVFGAFVETGPVGLTALSGLTIDERLAAKRTAERAFTRWLWVCSGCAWFAVNVRGSIGAVG